MFTGIVELCGEVTSLRAKGDVLVLVVKSGLSHKCQIGDSVAINGVCLTASKIEGDILYFDVSPETVKTTTTGRLTPGSVVNMELAMSANGRFGGHFVLGHVDTVGKILHINTLGKSHVFKVEVLEDANRYIVPKGSVTVDGISLTVASIEKEGVFTIAVIPHTAQITTLGQRKAGDFVNIEVDIIGKYVERFVGPFVSNKKEEVSNQTLLSKLTQEGFIK